MANYYGTPAIVTDGLVFAVDAGNGQSYVSGSSDTFSLVPVTYTGSLINDTQFEDINQGTWAFDGVGDYIDCGTTLGDQLGDNYVGNLSVSLWFKTNGFGDDGIFSMGLDGSYGKINVAVRSSELKCFFGGGTIIEPFTDTTSWHNVTLVYTSGSEANCNMYLDNSPVGTKSGGIPPATSTMDFAGKKMVIGAYYSIGYPFNGNIANCQVYNKALTAAEVLQNYNATKERFI